MIPEEEVSLLKEMETSFCYEDEGERAVAMDASRTFSDCISWAETVWASAEKQKPLQWVGYINTVEVGYVVLDLESRAYRAYVGGPPECRCVVGGFRDSTAAKNAVMFEVVELPLALCEAFEALRWFCVWAQEYLTFVKTVSQFNALHHSHTRASITG